MRFLVVDDDPVTRLFVEEELSAHGEVTACQDGETALSAFGRALEREQPFGVIFVDIMMPGLDGHTTLERIRALEDAAGVPDMERTPAVMVTALEDKSHVTRAFFRGRAVEYLHKPVSAEKLAQVLARVARPGG